MISGIGSWIGVRSGNRSPGLAINVRENDIRVNFNDILYADKQSAL
jgi:hypothetical protein